MRLPTLLGSLVVLSSLALGLAGCSGGGADVQTETRSTTSGQELMDLKKALDSGVITQAEYDRERKKILNRKE